MFDMFRGPSYFSNNNSMILWLGIQLMFILSYFQFFFNSKLTHHSWGEWISENIKLNKLLKPTLYQIFFDKYYIASTSGDFSYLSAIFECEVLVLIGKKEDQTEVKLALELAGMISLCQNIIKK